MTEIHKKTRLFYLYGSFADKFSKEPLELAADSATNTLLALKSIFPEWRKHAQQSPELIFVLTDDNKKNPRLLEAVFANSQFDDCTEVHVIPKLEGSGIETAALLGITAAAGYSAATIFAVNFIGSLVISMALGAIAQMLAPSPNTSAGSRNQVAENASFLYNGAANVTQQGGPVPVVYGYFLTGSTVISSEVSVEQLLSTPAQSVPPANGGGATQPTYPPAVAWQWTGT